MPPGLALRCWRLIAGLAFSTLWALEAQALQSAPAADLSAPGSTPEPLATLPGAALAWFGLMASVIAVRHSWKLLSAADRRSRR